MEGNFAGGPAPAPPSATVWRYGEHVIRLAQRRITRDGAAVDVEDRVFDLIALLLQQRDRAVERREVIAVLWGSRPVSDATLRQLVHKARRALGDDGNRQGVIRTLYGRSLQWVAPVTAVDGPESDEPVPAAESPAPAPVTAVTERLPAAARRRRAGWPALAAALLIGAIALAWWQPWRHPSNLAPPASGPTAAATAPVTIAVLPFLDLDAGHGESYLGDGLTEELINQLGRFPQLRVAARSSAFVFRDKPVDVREAARQLGVGHVLEGSVQRSGERIRVRVALVGASHGYELWATEYDARPGELVKVEGEIARAVIAELVPRLDPRALAALQARSTIDAGSHDFYLVGLAYLNRRTRADIERAIVYFRRAIQADPGYAPAWADVAMGYAILRDYDSDAPPDAHYADALAAANKAVALDPQLARAHAVLAQLHEEHWRWAQAAREFRQALALDPSNATAHQWYAMYLWFVGDMRGGLAQMQLAHELDPLSPIIAADLGRALMYVGRTDDAIAQYRTTIAATPRFALAHLFLAEAWMAQGRNAEALTEARTAVALDGEPPSSSYLAVLGLAQSLVGDQAGARTQLATLQSRRARHYVSGVSLALLHAQFGETGQVFDELSRAVTDHDHLMLPAIAAHDASWRADPRFADLLARMHLPAK